MDVIGQDLRFALRTLRRTPAFPLAAIGTLAIGIAATTAIFSTVNAALLKPLPYPNPSDLYSLRTALTDGRVTTGNLAPVEIIRLNDPSLSIVRAAGLHGQRRHAPAERRHAGENAGVRRQRRVLRAVRPANDPRRVPQRATRRTTLRQPSSCRIASGRTCSVAIRQSSARRSALPRSRRRWPASRRVISIRRPARISGSRSARSARRQSQLRRLHAGEAGHHHRARSERDGERDGGRRRATFPRAAAPSRVYVVRPLVESIVGELGPILSSCCRRPACCSCWRA